MKLDKPLRLIELFAGYGSQALALEYLNIPFEHHFVCEFDKYAMQSYNEIHNTDFKVSDIRDISADDLNIVETNKYKYLMTYSFPCTDLSVAGKQKGMAKGSNTSSSLLWEVERLLNECTNLPQYLSMENVPQVIGQKNINHFKQWTNFLYRLGYRNYYQIMNAADYGIPQHRERVIMVSILKTENTQFVFPEPIKLDKLMIDYLEPLVSDKYVLKGTSVTYVNDKLEQTRAVNGFETLATDGNTVTVTISTSSWHSSDNFIRCNQIGMLDINNYESVNRLYSPIGLCPTVKTCCGGSQHIKVQDKEYIRRLTPLECFRLMGVKDEDYNKLTCSDRQKYKQAGNSIVVNVLMAVFENLFIKDCKENRLF